MRLGNPLHDLSLVKPEYHPGPRGAPRVSTPRSAVVVGGGLAGCAAAMVLAERGVAVTLIERQAFLGGRAGGWADQLADGAPLHLDRGFHAFFRQYYNLRAFMRRSDPGLSRLVRMHDYPLLGPGGHQESFADLPRQTPFNIMSLVWRTPSLGLLDLMRIRKSRTLEMLRYDEERTYALLDDVTASDFLDSLNFPRAARQMLFEVFSHSFFNPEDDMSAADLVRMFHFYFTGNPEGLVFDVMDAPLGEGLWRPTQDYLEGLGVRVVLGTSATRVERQGPGRWRVVTGAPGGAAGALEADAVVLALTVPGLQAVVAASPDLDDAAWRRQIAAQGTTLPFAVWRLWLDRPARPDRAPFAGTAGLGMLDNISLYDRFQDEARGWTRAHGGAVVELHGYGLPAEAREAEIRASLWDGFLEAYPEFAGAGVVEERWRLDEDCPSFPPGGHRLRPGVRTPLPGVALAGDFVRLPVPAALMEGAVTSGFLAANELLSAWGVAGEAIRSVPRHGLLHPNTPRTLLRRAS
jgi:isorenieratene synthase